jgi:hypothetical protein
MGTMDSYASDKREMAKFGGRKNRRKSEYERRGAEVKTGGTGREREEKKNHEKKGEKQGDIYGNSILMKILTVSYVFSFVYLQTTNEPPTDS